MKTCKEHRCSKKAIARSMCRLHYKQWYRLQQRRKVEKVAPLVRETPAASSIGEDRGRGYNMQLLSGKAFFPMDPRPEDVDIEDIAHALSNICRFGGHSTNYYSVAQHSVMVSRALPFKHKLVGLLHDAAEAYIGDMISPVKAMLPDFAKIEHKIWLAIAAKFDLPKTIPQEVKDTDLKVCMTERRDLMRESEEVDWGTNLPKPLDCKIHENWAPFDAKYRFLDLYGSLTKQIH